ncbi:MAG TPA: cryptochrome/photolyase family protein [Marinagarivorans sp.]
MNKHYRTLRLILGDQLNASHRWYQRTDDTCLYLIAELPQELSYVRHHVQKVCAFFVAMENFACALKKAGHHVLHLTLDDTHTDASLAKLIERLCTDYRIQVFEYQLPDEYRLREQLGALKLTQANADVIPCNAYSTEHFLLGDDALTEYIHAGRHNRMESFYRKMRRDFNVLVANGKPTGGQWNYDAENRNKLDENGRDNLPEPLLFANDASDVLKRLKKHNIDTFGKAQAQLLWPCSRAQAKELLAFFCRHCLAHFGTYQDAMSDQTEHGWTLYHSRLSFALNSKMLHPMQVIESALACYNDGRRHIGLAQVEGFIRQILGWREYVRAVYWVNMPAYRRRNHLRAQRQLPDWFWTGKTKMNCLAQAIGQSLDYAYAHHIQRLMITGNFCLLAGIHPDHVDAWYLGIYIDAIEWVEMPNTRGMSQFADGGWVATKPYAASGNYVNKMSDYCRSCDYKVKEKIGENACPINALYWRFMTEHRDKLANNPRIGMLYKQWDKRDEAERNAIIAQAENYNLNDL